MKQRLSVLAIVFILIFIYIIPCQAAPEKERAGILSFNGPVDEEYRTHALNKLTSILWKFERYDLVERVEMERILGEQRFQLSGLVDPDTAVEIGQILAVNTAYIGSIDELTVNFDEKYEEYSAKATVTVKVINIQTAQILSVISGNGFSTKKGRNEACHTALDHCFDDDLEAKIRSFLAPYSVVIGVDAPFVYFENGRNVGLKKGLRYQVVRASNTEVGLETGPDEHFKAQIGLIEIEEVISEKSKARVIWSSTDIKAGDVLQEAPGKYGLGSLSVQTIPTNLGESLIYEGSYGIEIPFKGFTKTALGFGSIKGIQIIECGYQMGWELPVISGTLYFVPFGEVGISSASQEFSYLGTRRQGFGNGIYIIGGGGLKYYLNHEHGPRIELTLAGRYGPSIHSWEEIVNEKVSKVVTNRVDHPFLGAQGVLLKLTLSIPLSTDPFTFEEYFEISSRFFRGMFSIFSL